MKFNKVIREYLSEELTKKRNAANKADELTVAYRKKVNDAGQEITAIYLEAVEKVRAVLSSYGMTVQKNNYDLPIRLFEASIFNKDEVAAQRERESKRYNWQKELEKEIELECALGANRDKFMEMISKVEF